MCASQEEKKEGENSEFVSILCRILYRNRNEDRYLFGYILPDFEMTGDGSILLQQIIFVRKNLATHFD